MLMGSDIAAIAPRVQTDVTEGATRRLPLCKRIASAPLPVPARCGRGPMAEWLRRGLQILARRFDSGSGLHFSRRRGARGGSAALAQLVEHIIRNDGVTCSSHVSGTTTFSRQNQRIERNRCSAGRAFWVLFGALWVMKMRLTQCRPTYRRYSRHSLS